ncbi:unnamed protein product [Protopolystoma xenopodis]|uniref:Secreted protein n=1 Tax=Protopolystoma xenopodis TaxID=117903 RepID=A0A448XLY3_9PLAT|nr:unnamed protein product [Protopolystoma xenopodis]
MLFFLFSLICDYATGLHLVPRLQLPLLPNRLPACPFMNQSLGRFSTSGLFEGAGSWDSVRQVKVK